MTSQTTTKACRTCGFTDCPGATTGDCPRWPARDTAPYDQELIDRARTLTALHTVPDMRNYLEEHVGGDWEATELHIIVAQILGRSQAVIDGLLRIIEDTHA